MKNCIFIALDGLKKRNALSLVKKFSKSKNADLISGYKIHDLWDSYGPSIIRELKSAGARKVWVDIKLHDTPRTIALRATAVAAAGGDLISVHASSGLRGLQAAVERKIKVVAITVLTSLDKKEVKTVYSKSSETAALRLAHIAEKAGVWGIVCSAEEVRYLSQSKGLEKLNYIVPGIQRELSTENNQKRVGTPSKAFGDGATHIVLGRAVTLTANPLLTFDTIAHELRSVPASSQTTNKNKPTYVVYMLECKDGSFYTGITTDVDRRFAEHKAGKGGHYTRAKGVMKVVYTEKQPDRSSASKREAEIKGWSHEKKLALLHL